MSKRKDGQVRGKYTLEFKLEALRLVKGGQSATVTAKVLGMPKQTLDNWVAIGASARSVGNRDRKSRNTGACKRLRSAQRTERMSDALCAAQPKRCRRQRRRPVKDLRNA